VRRGIWYALGAIALGAIAFFIVHRAPPPAPPEPSPAVALATVRYGAYTVTLEEAGYAGAPAGTVTKLAFPEAGILRTLNVRVGERVRAGEPLAELDTRTFAYDAAQARAQAEAAEAGYASGSVPEAALVAAREHLRAAQERVAADRAEAARAARLYAAGVTALKDVQAARAQLAADEAQASTAQADTRLALSQPEVLRAQARAAQARAQSAELALNLGTLVAATGGVVTAIYRRPGESVDPSTPVLAVGPRQDEVTLSVPAADAAQMAVGDAATVRVAGSSRQSAGRVSAIVPAVDPATQTATVVIAGFPAGAVAGSAVRARITVAHVRGLLVPESAIVEDPQSGDDVVFVRARARNGPEFAQRVVIVAHENGNVALISSGLRAGERIAAEGAFQLLAPSGGS
jgi:HlyD family secretion protein